MPLIPKCQIGTLILVSIICFDAHKHWEIYHQIAIDHQRVKQIPQFAVTNLPDLVEYMYNIKSKQIEEIRQTQS